jgi:hypothetical protein
MTSVEWLVKMLHSPVCNGFLNGQRRVIPFDIIEQAKAMEKEQIIKSNRDGIDMVVNKENFITGEQYYNETYNK